MTSQAWLSLKTKFLRVVPFRGLLVDETTWADSHDYHRNQMRFHLLALHGVGIVGGLDVVASQPPDMNVTVRPGLAIDQEGRMLLLTEAQTVAVPRQLNLTVVYVMLEYKETATQTQNITEGGAPQISRLLEECQVKVSTEANSAGLELARITLEPNSRQIRNAASARQAANNEIDLGARLLVSERGPGGAGSKTRPAVTVGVVKHGPANSNEWKKHSESLRRMLKDASSKNEIETNLLDGVSLLDDNQVKTCRMLYMTGTSAVRLVVEEEQALKRHLDRGGLLWLEPCRAGMPSGAPDEFTRSSMELAQKLGRQPVPVRPGHPLLTIQNLFAAVPQPMDPSGTVVEANRLVVASGDYGCLWGGLGQAGEAPSREAIRSAHEFGANSLFIAAGPQK